MGEAFRYIKILLKGIYRTKLTRSNQTEPLDF
jgi:hypothetical protein